MLRMYERDPSIDIERIDWSILPYDGTSFEQDPNALLMRAEVRGFLDLFVQKDEENWTI